MLLETWRGVHDDWEYSRAHANAFDIEYLYIGHVDGVKVKYVDWDNLAGPRTGYSTTITYEDGTVVVQNYYGPPSIGIGILNYDVEAGEKDDPVRPPEK